MIQFQSEIEPKLSQKPVVPEKYRLHIMRVYSYISNHLEEDLGSGHIARELGLNPDYLGKLFKASVGRTIREYLNDARIMKARELLDEGGRRIIDIAMDVGFESVRSFYRCFYRAVGMTPTEYRERAERKV